MSLPRAHPVHKVLKNYISARPPLQHYRTIARTIKTYFDAHLMTYILYPSELTQYHDLKVEFPGMVESKIYGAEHLLRLFGR